MTDTPNLKLPYIAAAQAQKHVTHNEALRVLDVVVQLSIIDRDLTAPPGSPADGDRYIIGAAGTGAWATHDGKIAAWQDNAWVFHTPSEGWLCRIADEDVALGYDGTLWLPISSGDGASTNPTSLVGVNATADTTNRLSVASPASLFNHDGNGHQQKINKNATADTASQLYQTGFSSRAEIGLTGDDDFHFKVSPDGTAFNEAIKIDKESGIVSFPQSPGFEISYVTNAQTIPFNVITTVSSATLGSNTFNDSTFSFGEITIGAKDAGVWILSTSTQMGAVTLFQVNYETTSDNWVTTKFPARSTESNSINSIRQLSLSLLINLAAGDKIRCSVYQTNSTSTSKTLTLFQPAYPR